MFKEREYLGRNFSQMNNNEVIISLSSQELSIITLDNNLTANYETGFQIVWSKVLIHLEMNYLLYYVL